MSANDDDDDDVPLIDQPFISLYNAKLSLIPYDDSIETTEVQIVDNDKGKTHSRHILTVLSLISILLTIACGTITFYSIEIDQLVSAISFVMTLFLNVLFFVVIIWRFQNSHNDTLKYELSTLCLLAILLTLSGCSCLINSISDILRNIKPKSNFILIISSSVETILFSLLAFAKIILAKRLNVTSAYVDAFNTGINGLISLCVTVSAFVYQYINSNVWYMNPTMGMVISILTIGYGLYLLFKSSIGQYIRGRSRCFLRSTFR
ncbi:unnamed protein product [Didymodactylos carnosus]|uniref:Transmembrane protein 163 n=2 Tax=Didymodactylos carnosus TaxID=1234261 RepID=A0A8S2I0I1_9BILA|nr:unnamed protein product [Didymodactylos carnosus]CAF3699048.1 unnamed protein product [Didymodactylos carnosus]